MDSEHKERTDREESQGESVGAIPASAVDRQIFSERWILSPLLYQIYVDEEDARVMQEWKKEIDAEIIQVNGNIRNGTLKSSQKRTLGDDPTERDIILFCIARFIMRKQRNQKGFQWKFVKKCVPGGRHHIRELGEHFDTCMDTTAAAKALAELYGIEGEIIRPGKAIHYYWQAKEGNREIIDTLWARRNTGYARSEMEYRKIKNAGAPVPSDDHIDETNPNRTMIV